MTTKSVELKKDLTQRCTDCGLYRTAQSICLMGQGPMPNKVMIIGEAPGHREDDINKPFSGACGAELDELFVKFSYPRSQIYITNVVHCRPPRNRKPKPSEVKACMKWLKMEIEKVNPKFILLLGATAMKAFPEIEKNGSVTETRGRWFEMDDRNIMVTFHPGAILRDDRKQPIFETDIQKFLTTAKMGKLPREKGLNFRIAKTKKDISECLEDLENTSSYVSFDIETSGLSPFLDNPKIICIGLGLKDRQWIIPFNHEQSNFKTYDNQKIIAKLIAEALDHKKVIGQNGKFDSLWMLATYQVEIKMAEDTMMMGYLLDENRPNGLKPLAAKFFGAPEYDISLNEKQGKSSFESLAKYCALDVYYTRKLYFLFNKELEKDPNLHRFYKTVIMPVVNVYREIELNGIYINESKMKEAEDFLTEQVIEYKAKLDKFKKINWNSTQQVATYFFDDLGLAEIEDRSTKESVLKRLAGLKRFSNPEQNVPQLILKYKEHNGLLSKFITSWKPKLVNHHLHPSFKLNGTVTGRPSCEEPNLQQVPRDKRIRSLITAPDGWTLVEADFSQIELRVAAMLSGDKAMKLAFQTGQDIHSKTATMISGKDLTKLPKDEVKALRKKAKPVNFGFVYGMGWEGFQEYARDKFDMIFSDSECKQYRQVFFETYNGLPPWYERQYRIARLNGCIRSLSGRIRHLPNIYSQNNYDRSEAERQAINSPVQGLASDFTLMSVLEIYDSFSPEIVKICGTVHDAILMRVKNDYLNEVIPEVKRIMSHPKILDDLGINPTVPIEAEVAVGPWGDSTEWKPS